MTTFNHLVENNIRRNPNTSVLITAHDRRMLLDGVTRLYPEIAGLVDVAMQQPNVPIGCHHVFEHILFIDTVNADASAPDLEGIIRRAHQLVDDIRKLTKSGGPVLLVSLHTTTRGTHYPIWVDYHATVAATLLRKGQTFICAVERNGLFPGLKPITFTLREGNNDAPVSIL